MYESACSSFFFIVLFVARADVCMHNEECCVQGPYCIIVFVIDEKLLEIICLFFFFVSPCLFFVLGGFFLATPFDFAL